jgi:hypothetical protein
VPIIPLPVAFGLNSDGSLTPGAKLSTILPNFLQWKELPLDQVALQKVSDTLVFQEPLAISAGPIQLVVGENVGGSLRLIGEQHQVLDFDDPFSTIQVKAGEIYLALGLNFALMSGASIAADSATFGLSYQRDLELRCYRRFQSTAAVFPSFAAAFSATASSFVLPKTVSDLESLPSDTVTVLSGDGVFTATGGVTVGTPVQTLASTNLPLGKTLDLNASGSFETTISLTFTGSHELRLRRLAPRKVEIGIYGLKSREIAVNASAGAGVAVQIGTLDLTSQFIKALSRQPIIDVDEFRRAIPGEDPTGREQQIERIESSLKQAISSQVQASITATLSGMKSGEAAWLFEVDFDAATSADATKAITSALQGDFTALTATPGMLPVGITQTQSLFTRSNLHTQQVQVNLLGMANCLSLTKLLRVSEIAHSATGAITVMTDTSSASRLQALIVVAAIDHHRLRKLLSEDFVIEAAYHVSGLGVLPPEFLVHHTYFEIHDQTGGQEMKDGLDVGRVLGLISPEQESERLTSPSYGRTTFYVQTRYTNQDARRLFLTEAGQPHDIGYYETAGRSALGAVLLGDKGQEFRLRFAQLGAGDALWAQMKSIGNTAAFGPLFGIAVGSADPRIAAVGSDYQMIVTWASTMNSAAVALKEVNSLLDATSPGPDDPRLTSARAHLKKCLEDVVSKTHDHFGDPLGLLMAYIAGGQLAARNMTVTGPQIETLTVSSEPAMVAHA